MGIGRGPTQGLGVRARTCVFKGLGLAEAGVCVATAAHHCCFPLVKAQPSSPPSTPPGHPPRYLSFHFPFMTDRSMLAHLRAVPWRLDQKAFKAWRQGLTGGFIYGRQAGRHVHIITHVVLSRATAYLQSK